MVDSGGSEGSYDVLLKEEHPASRGKRVAYVLAVLMCLSGCGDGRVEEGWVLETVSQASGTGALLQAISPVSNDVVWVSGHQGTYALSADGGATWQAAVVPDADELQFRDVAAFDARTAYLMSSGSGALSRVYRTDDGGVSWRLLYTADHPDAFLDCMDFWSRDRGLVFGDAVDGVPFLLSTEDGGATWTRVPAEALPASLDQEGGFAASGTCLRTAAGGRAWVAMGNAERSRILTTADYGASWTVVDAPVVAGPAAGLATIDIAADGRGIALGGVIGNDTIRSRNVTVTANRGASWSEGGPLSMTGPVYGAALVPETGGVVVAVGPKGMDWSTDFGGIWYSAEPFTYWAVAFSPQGAGWAVGPRGRIVSISVEKH
ncbi:MAG: oxidoreductase [Gemmatimonadetes bacterium]|nr:oxidoreductase [Gemmatimonadota bacterium]MDA1102332.1 oxidoreductase [Gemmatimonadota bacterium]